MKEIVKSFVQGWSTVLDVLPSPERIADACSNLPSPRSAFATGESMAKSVHWVLERRLSELGYTRVHGKGTKRSVDGESLVLARKGSGEMSGEKTVDYLVGNDDLASAKNVFFRVQADTAPEFSADNAYSAPWGSSFITPRFYAADSEDDDTGWIAIYADHVPDSVGEYIVDRGASANGHPVIVIDSDDIDEVAEILNEDDAVTEFDSEPVVEANRGYSSFRDPAKLASYFSTNHASDGSETVVAFEGEYDGMGDDGEDLATPVRVLAKIPMSRLVETAGSESIHEKISDAASNLGAEDPDDIASDIVDSPSMLLAYIEHGEDFVAKIAGLR